MLKEGRNIQDMDVLMEIIKDRRSGNHCRCERCKFNYICPSVRPSVKGFKKKNNLHLIQFNKQKNYYKRISIFHILAHKIPQPPATQTTHHHRPIGTEKIAC